MIYSLHFVDKKIILGTIGFVFSLTFFSLSETPSEDHKASIFANPDLTPDVSDTEEAKESLEKSTQQKNKKTSLPEYSRNEATEEEILLSMKSLWLPENNDSWKTDKELVLPLEEEESQENRKKNTEVLKKINSLMEAQRLRDEGEALTKKEDKKKNIIQKQEKKQKKTEVSSDEKRVDQNTTIQKSIPSEKKEVIKPAITVPKEDIPTTVYANGEYTAIGKYFVGETEHAVKIFFSIEEDRVMAFRLTNMANTPQEQKIQNDFTEEMTPYIVGERLANIPHFRSRDSNSSFLEGVHRSIASLKRQARVR